MKALWKVTCEEEKYPGLWQLWFKKQCVAIGWPSPKYKLHERSKKQGWNKARNAVQEMAVGDRIIVALRGNCVGRIGEITGKAIEDTEWDPLVPIGPEYPSGEKGRRIFVRWDLEIGPYDYDLVVKLPEGFKLKSHEFRPTVSKIKSRSFEQMKNVMNDSKNWVGLLGKFRFEKALSDYISSYPNSLEDGLSAHPNFPSIRELVFKDRTRLDVLLMDRDERPVIVECKQHSPMEKDITQLRKYMRNLKRIGLKNSQSVRGILVHGGAQKVSSMIIREAKKMQIEIVSYRMRVDFFARS
jgi:hypothetical protein